MSHPSSLYEITSVFKNVDTGRREIIESLLAFSGERITLTFRVPRHAETFSISVDATCEEMAPLRAAVRRAYQDAKTG